jgi:hypothetical protein
MERRRTGSSLHELIAYALERAAHAQEESDALIEQCAATQEALHRTLDGSHRRRESGNAAPTGP